MTVKMTWGKGKIGACHMGKCGAEGGTQFDTFEDLAFHAQEIHGAGYYLRGKPAGYDERNPKEKDRVPERRNG